MARSARMGEVWGWCRRWSFADSTAHVGNVTAPRTLRRWIGADFTRYRIDEHISIESDPRKVAICRRTDWPCYEHKQVVVPRTSHPTNLGGAPRPSAGRRTEKAISPGAAVPATSARSRSRLPVALQTKDPDYRTPPLSLDRSCRISSIWLLSVLVKVSRATSTPLLSVDCCRLHKGAQAAKSRSSQPCPSR
jgi:hypothetical protein